MASDSLAQFIDSVCHDSHLRVETDFGDGFVRLRSNEAERRQAVQDIRSSEDAVIELLRNSRDAEAKHIFLATAKEGDKRRIVVVDDGVGIPPSMHTRIFEPRVTSKLDSAHMDKWGMHGRGMALYSISVNFEIARIACSDKGLGSSIEVVSDTNALKEKTDQSTFPFFVVADDGTHAMRGPKNILRTACEFALEHRHECEVFCGSPVEIAHAIYRHGRSMLTDANIAFCDSPRLLPLVMRLAASSDAAEFASLAQEMGLSLSERSARRIMNGEEPCIENLVHRMLACSFPSKVFTSSESEDDEGARRPAVERDARSLRVAPEDAAAIEASAFESISEIASRYYFEPGKPTVRFTSDAIHIRIPIEKTR